MIPRVRQLWLANAALTLTVAIALGPINTADTPRYLNLARSLGGGLGFTIDETGEREPEGFRMPGYPAWLAATEGMAPGRTATATLIGQQFAMLLSLGFAWSAARQTMGDRRGSVLLALSALYPFTPAASCQLSPEAFTAPMISGAWLLLCKIDPLRGALAGVLIGSATYFRPNMLALAPVAALALMAGRERGRYRSGGALLAGTALVLLPWAVRNQMVFGTISPLPPAGASGRVLLVATWEARVPISSLVAYSATGRPDQNLIAAGIEEQIHRANSAIGVPSNTRVALEQYRGNRVRARASAIFRDEAVRNIREQPFGYLFWAGVRSVRAWFSMAAPPVVSKRVSSLLWLPVLWGAFLALAGLGGALHSGVSAFGAAPGLRVGVALLAGFGLTLCWFQTEARYTIPARHMLLAFASIPVASLVTRALDRLGGQASQSDSGCRSVNPSLVSSLCLAKMFPQIKRRLRRDWGRRPPGV